uniref:Uncharacterized protein n=1 Tax=Anopheles arabiensis TaxID=7173 RepID=A0A182I0W9_ANOAR
MEYDPAADEIIGACDNIQVVMGRWLFKNWKQPIYVGIGKNMTKAIILDINEQLFTKGINVAAIVSANGATDDRLKIEMSPLFKQTKGHLTLSSQERQNVRRAAVLFSRSTTISLPRYCEDEKLLAHFIETVDLWFSVSPSRLVFSKNGRLREGKIKFKHSMICITMYRIWYQMRSNSGENDHPCTFTCIYRIRLIILGKSLTMLRNVTHILDGNGNIDCDSYVTSHVVENDIVVRMRYLNMKHGEN